MTTGGLDSIVIVTGPSLLAGLLVLLVLRNTHANGGEQEGEGHGGVRAEGSRTRIPVRSRLRSHRLAASSSSSSPSCSDARSCCTGGEISYAFSTHGSLSILFEQGTSFQPPYAATMEEIALENWPGIRNFFM